LKTENFILNIKGVNDTVLEKVRGPII